MHDTPMRILFLNHNLYERGTFFRAFHLARNAVRQGHSVELWTTARNFNPAGQWFMRDGVRIWQPPRWFEPRRHDGGYAPLDVAARLIRTCSRSLRDFDIIHAFDHRPNVSFPWYLFRWLRGANTRPLLLADWCDWWTRGGITTDRRTFLWLDQLEAYIEEGSKQCADGVTVISNVLMNRAAHLGIHTSKLKLLPSGCDVEGIRLEDRWECRRRLGWPEEHPLLCFVGLALWDLELIADAILLLRTSYPTLGLMIVGGGVEADAIRKLESRLDGIHLLIPGVVAYNELSHYLGAADIHLLPLDDNLANQARVPNKLGDYMASGRPVVTNDIGDTGEYVSRQGIGLAVKPQEMAEAIGNLLADPNLRETMGNRARQLAEGSRSWESITTELMAFYDEISSK